MRCVVLVGSSWSGVEALVDATARLVAEGPAARAGALVVRLDDVSADEAERVRATVLHGDAPVLLGLRNDRPWPEPFHWVLRELAPRRLDVPTLQDAEIATQVLSGRAGVVDPSAAAALRRLSAGEHRWTDLLIRSAVGSGALVANHGVWRIVGRIVPSVELRRATLDRVAGLSAAERTALSTLALLDLWPMTVATRLVGDELIEQLEAARLVVVTHDRVALAPPMLAGVLRHQRTEHRHDRARRVLERLRGHEDVEIDTTIRVALQLLARDDVDPADLLDAAQAHADNGQLIEARELAERAISQGSDRSPAFLLLAKVLKALGDRDALRKLLDSAFADTQPGSLERVYVTVQRAEFALWDDADATTAARLSSELLEQDVSRWMPPARALAFDATMRLFAGDPAAALSLRDSVDWSTAGGTVASESAVAVAAALAVSGGCREAISIARRGLELRLSLPDDVAISNVGTHVANLGLAIGEAGDFAAEAMDPDGLGRLVPFEPPPVARAWIELSRARAALWTGDLATADHAGAIAEGLFSAAPYIPPLRWAIAARLLANAYRRDVQSCVALEERFARLDAPIGLGFLEPDVLRALAWSAWARGDMDRAVAGLHEAAAVAARTGQSSLEATALHDLVRIGRPEDALAGLEALEDSVESQHSAIRIRHARGLVNRDVEELVATADAFFAIGCMVLGGEALGHAQSALAGQARSGLGAEVARRFRSIAPSIEGVATPALASVSAGRLTAREMEVAEAAARGMSSREIAVLCSMSLRTVENHLLRIYRKLGVANRAELAGALS